LKKQYLRRLEVLSQTRLAYHGKREDLSDEFDTVSWKLDQLDFDDDL
jgi:hypothetical protein